MNSDQVTACLVTRGDQPDMMRRIHDSLVFANRVIWDNSVLPDRKTAGRYCAAKWAATDVVYFQDDDVIVPAETQQALIDAYEPGVMVANWAHGDDPDGYDDLPLVGAGAIADRDLVLEAEARYLERFPNDDDYLYDCDFAVGVLYPKVVQLRLPFHVEAAVATHPSRLCNQPWQQATKLRVANQARSIRVVA
jgi:hypothetical protein